MNQLLNGDIVGFVTFAISLIVAITVHEFAHAAAATWLGDSLPGRQGRLTLSPLAHLDPIGTILIFIGGFGWGRPVQVNPYALRTGPRVGTALVALAGPVSNLIMATLFALIVRGLELGMDLSDALAPTFVYTTGNFFVTMVQWNLLLAFFNLIPIFPLDGFSVLLGLLPPTLAYRLEQTRSYGIMILFALVFFGGSVLSVLIGQPARIIAHLLLG